MIDWIDVRLTQIKNTKEDQEDMSVRKLFVNMLIWCVWDNVLTSFPTTKKIGILELTESEGKLE